MIITTCMTEIKCCYYYIIPMCVFVCKELTSKMQNTVILHYKRLDYPLQPILFNIIYIQHIYYEEHI